METEVTKEWAIRRRRKQVRAPDAYTLFLTFILMVVNLCRADVSFS